MSDYQWGEAQQEYPRKYTRVFSEHCSIHKFKRHADDDTDIRVVSYYREFPGRITCNLTAPAYGDEHANQVAALVCSMAEAARPDQAGAAMSYTFNVWSPSGTRYWHGCDAATAAAGVMAMQPGATVQRGAVVLYELGEPEPATPELLNKRAAVAVYPHALSTNRKRDKPWQDATR